MGNILGTNDEIASDTISGTTFILKFYTRVEVKEIEESDEDIEEAMYEEHCTLSEKKRISNFINQLDLGALHRGVD